MTDPSKPTDAMIEAGVEQLWRLADTEGDQPAFERGAVAIYTAMHEARPQSAAPSPDARSILQSDLGPLTDVFDRMDADEQNEIVERLAEALRAPANNTLEELLSAAITKATGGTQ